MKQFFLSCTALLVVCVTPSNTITKVTLTSIWGDDVVLQQQADVRLTGAAKKNSKIMIKASWSDKRIMTQSDSNGRWQTTLHTTSAGGPYFIIFPDGEVLTLRSILLDEVWFCSGQFNMEMPVRGFEGQPVYGCQPYIVSANPRRRLRLYTVQRDQSTTPETGGAKGQRMELSSRAVDDFSATAYFFGNLLQRSINVPVGLTHSSWNASKIEVWMNRQILQQFSEVELPDINQSKFGWEADTPTLLWNVMVNPWKGFPTRGVIWYQGEADVPNPALYKRLFPAMMQQWRTFFENKDMPIYYMQIAPYQAGGKDKLEQAWSRQCQLELMSEVPNVGMVTTTDADSELSIHPPYKMKVGKQLAYWALAKTYGRSGFLYSGLIYKSCMLKDGIVGVTFEYGQEGMIPESREIRSFEPADASGKIYPANARIINNTAKVKVWNDSVCQSTEMCYCFRNYMQAGLYNNAGLPASPFRAEIK